MTHFAFFLVQRLSLYSFRRKQRRFAHEDQKYIHYLFGLGANWAFIIWGGLNALYFMPLLLADKNRQNLEVVAMDKLLPSFKEFFKILLTFGLTCFA